MAKYDRDGYDGYPGCSSAIRRLHRAGSGAGSHLGRRTRRRVTDAGGYGHATGHGHDGSGRHTVPNANPGAQANRCPGTHTHSYPHAGANSASDPNSRADASSDVYSHAHPGPDANSIAAQSLGQA